jgi:uncharacterized membrane protein YdcZ (DUF606 family)
MQHKPGHKDSHNAKQEPSVKHKLSFHVTAGALCVFTIFISTAAFAAIGLITTASKIVAH